MSWKPSVFRRDGFFANDSQRKAEGGLEKGLATLWSRKKNTKKAHAGRGPEAKWEIPMKSKRNLFQICLLWAVLLALPAATQAQFIFTTNDGTITITDYIGSGGDVTIPDTTNGLPITGIAEDAFFASLAEPVGEFFWFWQPS
jgi:hypothetical protein